MTGLTRLNVDNQELHIEVSQYGIHNAKNVYRCWKWGFKRV